MVSRRSVVMYVMASFIVCFLFLADYANTYREFYPMMIALANSSFFRLLVVNTAISFIIVLWMVLQTCFFGELNASEETALLTSFTLYLVECILVPLYMDEALLSAKSFFFLFTLVWRVLHKLASERVTTLSTMQMTWVSATRMPAYLCFAIIVDAGVLTWMIKERPALSEEKSSMHYSIILLYMLLLSSSLRSAVHFSSLFALRGQHTLLSFVADAIVSIAESLLFISVYTYIFYKSALPLLLLRGFVEHVLRIFEKTSGLVEFLVLTRRVRSSMPDATAEDLARDGRCTICYEEMVLGGGTKRLSCGHCYHIDCLERWLEGHSTCPYCRANIMQMHSGSRTATSPVEEVEPVSAGVREDTVPPQAQAVTAGANAVVGGHLPISEETQQQHTDISADIDAEVREAYEQYRRQLFSASCTADDPTITRGDPAPVFNATRSPQHCAVLPVSLTMSSRMAISADPATPDTVEGLKMKAYREYHRRLQEAERDLQVALQSAEALSGAP